MNNSDWKNRWERFKHEHFTMHSEFWLKNKQETIADIESFIEQEIEKSYEKGYQAARDRYRQREKVLIEKAKEEGKSDTCDCDCSSCGDCINKVDLT